MDQRAIAHHLVPIVYEDDHYVFVSKPVGLASLPRAPARDASVLDRLAGRADATTLLPLYDINRWQSGVLGYAKTEEARRHLLTGLETGSARPVYLAVVRGRLRPRPQTIAAAIKQVGPDRFAVDRKAPQMPRPATRLEPLDHGEDHAMLRCRPGVLNHHQVRAHLQSVNLRVVGDAVYRPKPDRARIGPMMLHLAELRFHHPGVKHAVTIRAETPPDFAAALDPGGRGGGLDGALTMRLRAALAARLPCWLDEGTDAFRILDGRADAMSGLVAELYGDVLVLQAHQGKFDAGDVPVPQVAQWYRRQLGVTAVYVKRFAKDRSRSGSGPDELRDPKPLAGKPAPERFAAREHGLRFLVRPYDGHSVGLFLDHRENRRRVGELAGGRSVLNLFCHTCGFSVAAAVGGARSTVNVDISRKSLEWGKENFRANGLALDDHTFINDNAFDYFKRAGRQRRTFDLIVIDPPSFARVKKGRRVFTVEKDLQRVAAGAISLLSPNGLLLAATNHRGASRKWLREQVNAAAGSRRVTAVSTPPLPIDFAEGSDHAKTVIVRIG